MSTRTVYRAASRTVILPATFGRGACFSETLRDAESYMDNQGFGGAVLAAYSAETTYRLECTGRGRAALVALADGLELDDVDATVEGWQDRGIYEVFQALENVRGLEEKAAEMYDWIVYDEPTVGSAADCSTRTCRTWRYYGPRPMVGRLAA